MNTWLITGTSTGLGRALALAALAQGDTVVGTLRNEAQRAEFDALAPGRSHGVLLDVTHEADIRRVVDEVESGVGAIDVLVNNAGYGFESTIEEASMADIRHQFEVNVFGALGLIKAVLPHMRGRRGGRIINITSIGGLTTGPGIGIYNASKFALEAISESLGKETAGFGVKVTAVEPGAFRTDWAGRSLKRSTRSIAEYTAVCEPISEARSTRSGHQRGDPAKAAAAILQIVASDDPPAHLLLGSDALKRARTRLEELGTEFERWASLAQSTDFDE